MPDTQTQSTPDDGGGTAALVSLLATYRMAVYLGGLAVIGAPLALRSAAGVTVPASVRAALTVTTLAVMVVTYLAERRSRGREEPSADAGSDTDDAVPFRTRVAAAAAVLGLALGVYLGVEVSPLAGLLFVGGAYLFAYVAYGGGGS